jgi:hypothetical protein
MSDEKRLALVLSADEKIEESALGLGILKEISPVLKAGRNDQHLVARLHRSVQPTGVASEALVLPSDEKERPTLNAAHRRESIKATELPRC